MFLKSEEPPETLPMRAAINILRTALLLACSYVTLVYSCHAKGSAAPHTGYLYIGTLTTGDQGGIYRAEFDTQTGNLRLLKRAVAVKNASFLATDANSTSLYATCESEQFTGSQGGALAAFRIDADSGSLTFLNDQSSGGGIPCHVTIDRQGRFALVANYAAGNVAVVPIVDGGRLESAVSVVQHRGSSIHEVRQSAPHPHSVTLDPSNRFAFVADAGIDRIVVYRFHSDSGELTAEPSADFQAAPGAAPRHLAFHPSGKMAVVINELNSTLILLRYDAETGKFSAAQTLPTLPTSFAGENLTADVLFHPRGAYVYGSNRGHDSLAMFAVDAAKMQLTSLGQHPAGGRMPRSFCIDSSGKFLLSAQQDSDTVVVHRIDPRTGTLVQSEFEIHVPQPLCLRLVEVPGVSSR